MVFRARLKPVLCESELFALLENIKCYFGWCDDRQCCFFWIWKLTDISYSRQGFYSALSLYGAKSLQSLYASSMTGKTTYWVYRCHWQVVALVPNSWNRLWLDMMAIDIVNCLSFQGVYQRKTRFPYLLLSVLAPTTANDLLVMKLNAVAGFMTKSKTERDTSHLRVTISTAVSFYFQKLNL